MKPIFKLLYREKGVRYAQHLMSPRIIRVTELPRSSLYHYVPSTPEIPDIDTSLTIFKGYNKKIHFEQVLEYFEPKGGFRRLTLDIKTISRPFRRSHIRTWVNLDEAYKTVSNPETLIVMNYGYLDKRHRYYPLPLSRYYQWENRTKTIYKEMEKIANASDRNQFFHYPLPLQLQGRTILDKFATQEPSLRLLNVFGNEGDKGYFQLDLWRWINPATRSHSLLSLISPKNYSKINLILVGRLGEVLVNLGYLNSFLREQPNMTDMPSVTQLDHILIQKLSLKAEMALNSLVQDDDIENIDNIPAASPSPAHTPQPRLSQEPSDELENPDVDEEILEANEEETDTARIPPAEKELPSELITFIEPTELDIEKPKPIDTNVFKALEKDIATLDQLSLRRVNDKDLKELDTSTRRESYGGSQSSSKAPTSNALSIKPKQKPALQKVADVKEEDIPVDEDEPLPELEDFEFEEVLDIDAQYDVDEVIQEVTADKKPEEHLLETIEKSADSSRISAAEYRKLKGILEDFENSINPYDEKTPRTIASKITPEDIAINTKDTELEISGVNIDPRMKKATLNVFDKQYVKKVLKKDVLKTVDSIQNTGIAVKSHQINTTTSVLGTYEHHTLELKPVDGAPSVVKFSLPKVESDGTFTVAGVKYRMRTQRADLPIRKIAPQIVSLSTYYGKTFVQVSPKVTNNSLTWLIRQINLAMFNQDGHITDIKPGEVYSNEFKAPYIYNALAQSFSSLKAGDIFLNFNKDERHQYVPSLEAVEKNGRVVCGTTHQGGYVIVNTKNTFYSVINGKETELGNIYEILNLDTTKMPNDIVEVRIFSKYIPVGVVLAYYLGFSKLLTLLQEPFRVVQAKKRKNLTKDEYAISFLDRSYIFSNKNRKNTLILSGFNEFEKQLKMFDRRLFDTKDVYFNLFLSKGLTAIYTRELDLMEHAFVDHISKEILADMGEPVTFKGLLIRSVEMMDDMSYPIDQDRAAMRDRGYERFSGILYKEMMTAIREFKNKNILGRSKVNISPYKVWNSILEDNAIKIVEDTNPIQNLKEQEIITFAGIGGRSTETMTKPTRAFHKNDIGVLSESTVDSSSVGTIAYLSANPNIGTVRGLLREEKELTPTSMLSTSALISPCSMSDTPKRMMFISTQHGHTIASAGYKQPYVRTGYEQVVARRTSAMYSIAAEQDGKVISLTDKGMIVEYADGEKVGIDLGRQYGKAEGSVYPHDIHTTLKLNSKFKKGDILAYNTKFFEPDFIDPKNIILKLGSSHRVAFMELNQTFEDSCAISSRLNKLFTTEVVKIKNFTMNFGQEVRDIVKPGDIVEPNTPLFTMVPEISAEYTQFSDESLEALTSLGKMSPKAMVSGLVEKIEVYYNGDTVDMSPTLRRITQKSDNDMAVACKSTGKTVVTGRVNNDYRVNGNPLEPNRLELRIYISIINGTGVGDKVVFGHQMKSTISEVMPGDIITEDGQVVDAVFSYGSAARRGVLSPAILGTTTTLLDAISKQAAKIYFGD